ncbi:MAG: flagellar type III secretion system pore protein FliP [Phycisphaerales bacterium]
MNRAVPSRLISTLAVTTALGAAAGAVAQSGGDGAITDTINPVTVLDDASKAIPGFEGGLVGAINIVVLLTILTLAPAIVMMTTCFTRIIVVLSLLRQAMGTQSLPPSQVMVALSLFLTLMVMAPTFERVYDEAIVPYQQGDPAVQSQVDVWSRARQPLRDFMFAQIDATGNWDSVLMILEYRGVDVSEPSDLKYADVDMLTLVPAFMLSELKIAFLIGFRVYLPFLIIDMVIASLLISMGMLMLPPVLISLPFKILLFVLVDGWNLIVGNLMTSFVQPTQVASAVGAIPYAVT